MRCQLRCQARIVRGAAAVSALGALLLGTATASGDARLEPTLSVSETYSDNVDRDPRAEREDAFITNVRPGATLRWDSARLTTAIDAAASFSHQTAGDDKGVTLEPDAAGLASLEVWPEHLFFDASAAASSELLNTQQEDTAANRSTVQTYTASPRLLNSFGDFADAEAAYKFTQVIESSGSTFENGGGSADSGDSQTHAVRAALSAGPSFSTIRWALNGSASEQDRQNDSDVSRRDASLDLEYIVDRSFSLLGGVGYQKFDDGDRENDIDGLTWDTGFRWRPGSRTDITVIYGRTDERNSFNADAQHQLSPQTRVFATYSEVLETGQERLAADLDFIGTDPETGELIDTRTGQPFDPQTAITTVDDDTQRTKTLAAGINGTRGRNTFGLAGRLEFTRDVGSAGANDNEDAYNIGASWGRRLSPRASLNTSLSYTQNEFELERRVDKEYGAGVTYTYNIFRNVNAFGAYNFGAQTSNEADREFLENRVTLGVSMAF